MKRERPSSSIKIPNYREHRNSISEILRSQSKVFYRKVNSRANSISRIENSVDCNY